MTTKVSKTEKYTDSQGEHLVCKGKLVLILAEEKIKHGELFAVIDGYNKISGIYFAFQDMQPSISHKLVKPVIISELEDIEDGDLFLQVIHKGTDNECPLIATMLDKNFNKLEDTFLAQDLDGTKFHSGKHHERRILAMFDNLTYKQLQPIVTGKLKDGDDVYLECETIKSTFGRTPLELKTNSGSFTRIKDFYGKIKLFKYTSIDTWYKEVFVLPEHYSEVQEVGYMGRGTHSVSQLEDIVENYKEVIHQLRVKMQNAIINYEIPNKKLTK